MQAHAPHLDPEFERTLKRVMLDRPLPCPHCGYSLSGLAGTRCPECGRNLRDFLRVLDTSPRRVRRELLRRSMVRGARAGGLLLLAAAGIAAAMTFII